MLEGQRRKDFGEVSLGECQRKELSQFPQQTYHIHFKLSLILLKR